LAIKIPPLIKVDRTGSSHEFCYITHGKCKDLECNKFLLPNVVVRMKADAQGI